jgi:hypothetical protein
LQGEREVGRPAKPITVDPPPVVVLATVVVLEDRRPLLEVERNADPLMEGGAVLALRQPERRDDAKRQDATAVERERIGLRIGRGRIDLADQSRVMWGPRT